MELTLIDYNFTQQLPSKIAAAALYISIKVLDNSEWVRNLIKLIRTSPLSFKCYNIFFKFECILNFGSNDMAKFFCKQLTIYYLLVYKLSRILA